MNRVQQINAEELHPGDVIAANHTITQMPFACLVYDVQHVPKGVIISFLSSNAIGEPIVAEQATSFRYGTAVAILYPE